MSSPRAPRPEQRAFGPETPPAPPSAPAFAAPAVLATAPADEKDEKDGRFSWASSRVSTLPEYGYTSRSPPPFVFRTVSDAGEGDADRERDGYTLRSVSPTSFSKWPMPPGNDPRWPVSMYSSESRWPVPPSPISEDGNSGLAV